MKGNTFKNYVDAIQRKLKREDNSLYVSYGNWDDSAYIIVKAAIDDEVMREAVAMVVIVFGGLRGNEVHGIMINCLSFLMHCDSASLPCIFEMVKKFSCEICNP